MDGRGEFANIGIEVEVGGGAKDTVAVGGDVLAGLAGITADDTVVPVDGEPIAVMRTAALMRTQPKVNTVRLRTPSPGMA